LEIIFNRFTLEMIVITDKGIQPVSMSDRPIVADYKPSHIPHVVSDSDLKKTVEDWEQLLFDIETEVSKNLLDQYNHLTKSKGD
jgi:predicted AlkP superfamily pyrophosphatase or phosphodiesterase